MLFYIEIMCPLYLVFNSSVLYDSATQTVEIIHLL